MHQLLRGGLPLLQVKGQVTSSQFKVCPAETGLSINGSLLFGDAQEMSVGFDRARCSEGHQSAAFIQDATFLG